MPRGCDGIRWLGLELLREDDYGPLRRKRKALECARHWRFEAHSSPAEILSIAHHFQCFALHPFRRSFFFLPELRCLVWTHQPE